MKVEDEVFGLANELVRRFHQKETHECNFALERSEFMSDDDFTYNLPETPYFLEKLSLADKLSDDWAIVAPSFWTHKGLGLKSIYEPSIGEERKLSISNSLRSHRMNVPGFYAVSFKIDALDDWLENEMQTRIGNLSGTAVKVPQAWKWLDEKNGVYQFGELGTFQEGNGVIAGIFHEAMNLFHETPQTISIAALSERTGIDHKVLRSRLQQISVKLKKFDLKFVGSGKGYYRIESTGKHQAEPTSE